MVKISYVSQRGVKGTRTDTRIAINKWLSQMVNIKAIHKYQIDSGSWQTVKPMGKMSEFAAPEYKKPKVTLGNLPNGVIIIGGLTVGYILMKVLKK